MRVPSRPQNGWEPTRVIRAHAPVQIVKTVPFSQAWPEAPATASAKRSARSRIAGSRGRCFAGWAAGVWVGRHLLVRHGQCDLSVQTVHRRWRCGKGGVLVAPSAQCPPQHGARESHQASTEEHGRPGRRSLLLDAPSLPAHRCILLR